MNTTSLSTGFSQAVLTITGRKDNAYLVPLPQNYLCLGFSVADILSTVSGIHTFASAIAEFFGNRTEVDQLCETIRMTDAEFKSLYLNTFPLTYIVGLFMTQMIMGLIFVAWNGECHVASSKEIVEKMLGYFAFSTISYSMSSSNSLFLFSWRV